MRAVFFTTPNQPAADHLAGGHEGDRAVLWTGSDPLAYQMAHLGIPTVIGGAFPPYTGPGTRYYEGMLDDGWRWAMITGNVAAARQTRQVLIGAGGVHAGWYLTEEGDLTALAANEALRLRYEWAMIEIMRQLHQTAAVPFLWSPWASGSVRSTAVTAARRTLIGARDWLRPRPIAVELHFQDGVGAGHHSPEQAAAWGAALLTLPCPTAMNLELYQTVGEGPDRIAIPATKASVLEREKLYRLRGLQIGAQWDADHWYYHGGFVANHGGHGV